MLITRQKAQITKTSVAATLPGDLVGRMRKAMAILRGWHSISPSLLVHGHGQEVGCSIRNACLTLNMFKFKFRS